MVKRACYSRYITRIATAVRKTTCFGWSLRNCASCGRVETIWSNQKKRMRSRGNNACLEVSRRTITVFRTSLRKSRRNRNIRIVNSSLNFPLHNRIIATLVSDAGSMSNHIFVLDPPYDTFVKYRTNKFLRRARTIVHVRSLQSYAAFPEKLVSEEKQIA